MDPAHLNNFSEAQLASAIKPLLAHDSWPYFEEYLRREQYKTVQVTMSATDTSLINRGQGKFNALSQLLTLKQTLLSAS